MSWVRGSVYDVEGLTEFTAHWTSSGSGVLMFVLLGCGSCVVCTH